MVSLACLLPERGGEASLFLIWGEGRGVSRGRPEGWLRCFAHRLGGVVCRGHVQYPAFAPNPLLLLQTLQKWQLGFLVSLYLLSKICPSCSLHAVIFSPI